MVVTRKEWGGKPGRQASVTEPPLHHPIDVHAGQGSLGQRARLAIGRPEEGSVFRRVPETGLIQVFKKHLFQIVPDGDIARLAAFLIEVQHPLLAGIVQTAAPDTGHGRRASCGVN